MIKIADLLNLVKWDVAQYVPKRVDVRKLAEDEGFDCRFAGGKSYGALGIAPSGKAPPEPCIEMGSNPTHVYKKQRHQKVSLFFGRG